jgi:hypothetical protein
LYTIDYRSSIERGRRGEEKIYQNYFGKMRINNG